MTPRPTVGLMLSTAANTDDGRVDPQRVLATARRAEDAGFDGVYLGDHVVHPRPLLESVVSLAAVAATTSRVSLGPCVMLLALRDPVVLAKQLGTLAAYAPGRLRVGVGVGGEYPAEFDAVGVALAERGARLDGALRRVRELLHDDIAGDGTLAPTAPSVPFLLAGWKGAALRRAARLGDGWIGYLQRPDGFRRRREQLTQLREEAGTADRSFTTGMLLHVHVGPDVARARAHAVERWSRITASSGAVNDELFLGGPADAVVEQLHAFWSAGCTEFVLGPADQGHAYADQVEALAADVLPAVRRFT